MARANSSLPVPDSPPRRTVAPVEATFRTCSVRAFSAGSSPMILGIPNRSANSSLRRMFSVTSLRWAAALSTSTSRWEVSTGLERKSKAPSFMARTASSTVP
jgi:hypothetical protein